jgi:hypothetical protein
MIWPQRSVLFMLLMLVLSSGAFALFWYADADRRMRKTGRSMASRSLMWLSLGIFAAALATRGIQVLVEPASFQEVSAPLLGIICVLHLLWAILMLRLLRREFPEFNWHPVPSLIFGPLYFQSRMQRLPVPSRQEDKARDAMEPEAPTAEPLLLASELHPAEEGHEPRSEGV